MKKRETGIKREGQREEGKESRREGRKSWLEGGRNIKTATIGYTETYKREVNRQTVLIPVIVEYFPSLFHT